VAPSESTTPEGGTINEIYWVVFGICALVFLLVEVALVLFVLRFRRRPRIAAEAEGPQIHGNTRLEIIWTIIPSAVLVLIAVYAFARTPAVVDASGSGEPVRIRVDAHQFYWQYEYPNGALSFDTLRLPVNRPVVLELVARDVDHSWWVPELGGKRDAIPGRTNTLEFTPTELGTFEGQCAEHCGTQHAVMYTRVIVTSQQEYDRWLQARRPLVELGRAEWEAACAKCHGPEGEGDYGPAIAGNGTIQQKSGALIDLLNRGQDTPTLAGHMPPVGIGWSGRQYDALVAYIRSNPTLSGAGEQGGTGGG
jgi:cytochrome c oxidase subunit 2